MSDATKSFRLPESEVRDLGQEEHRAALGISCLWQLQSSVEVGSCWKLLKKKRRSSGSECKWHHGLCGEIHVTDS